MPLTVLRLVLVSDTAGLRGWPLGPCGRGDRPGWSGRLGGRPAGGLEQVHPFLLAVPLLGQVQGDLAASLPGNPGGHGDEVAADGRSAGPGVEPPGQRPGGPGQVMGRCGRRRFRQACGSGCGGQRWPPALRCRESHHRRWDIRRAVSACRLGPGGRVQACRGRCSLRHAGPGRRVLAWASGSLMVAYRLTTRS